MDHQIEHDVDIQRSRRKYAQAMDFEKHGMIDQGQGGAHCRIEPLQVTDLSHSLVL